MRVSRLAAALGVAAAVLLGGATGASAATYAPSVVSHVTYDRGHDHGDYGRGDRDDRWGNHDRDDHGDYGRGDRDDRWGNHDRDDRCNHGWGHDRWGNHDRDDRCNHGWGHDRYGHR
ncbi:MULTISPECIES: hypothetical protein [unclassified Streptomyces]|uniref:hypothetical protein n=1 Tax=unclassified Streptomyces TaxID=2593676 RepID=UPI003D8AC809